MKTVLGTQANADLFIDILELLIPEKHITSITMLNKEYHGLINSEKRSTFDLLCRDDTTKEEFLVEVQNADKASFRERVLFYSYFPMREQLEKKRREFTKKGKLDKMDYSINPVYVVSILNFKLEHASDDALENGLISRYNIRNGSNGEILTEALNFVFLEMGRMKYGPEEYHKCRNRLERFVFSFKYMHTFEEFPSEFEDDPMLERLAFAAKLANLTMDQLKEYESKMRTEIDRWAEINFAREEGEKKGREEEIAKAFAEKQQMVRALLNNGVTAAVISASTGLSVEEVEALKE